MSLLPQVGVRSYDITNMKKDDFHNFLPHPWLNPNPR